MAGKRKPCPYEKYSEAVRARGHDLNPYRLGLEVGRAGDDLPNPYFHRRSRVAYADGVKRGLLEMRSRAQSGAE